MDMLVLRACPDPDVIDTQTIRLPPGSPDDPAWWAHEIFATRQMPGVVVALLALRQALVGLIGVAPATSAAAVFAVEEVVGDEALIIERDRHLDFACTVGIDRPGRLLSVTTAVELHGWRGRLYWLPVGLLHGPITRSIMRRAIERSTRADVDAAGHDRS